MSKSAAYEALLFDLKALVDKPAGSESSRRNLIKLLKTLSKHLELALNEAIDANDPVMELYEYHPVCLQLLALARSLEDLDLGKTDEILQRNPYGAPASRSWRRREEDIMICTALDAIQAQRRYRARAKAARRLAQALNGLGWSRNQKRFTGDRIEGIYKRYKAKAYSD